MNPFCNSCGGPLGGCGHCGQCQPKCGCADKCPKPCGCPESILSIEADSTNPTNLRFNLGGRSVWYDFDSVVKAGETCTNFSLNKTERSLVYHGECQDTSLYARDLGSIMHLGDIGDVDETTIGDNAILVYRKDANCAENCDGKNGWIGINPVEASGDSLNYILGSDGEGDVGSLRPPANTNQFHYLAWKGQNKAGWTRPTVVANKSSITDSDGKVWALYVRPSDGEIVIVKENP